MPFSLDQVTALIAAIKDLINCSGFKEAATIIIVGGVLYYFVGPIPSKLDALLIAVAKGCAHQEGTVATGFRGAMK